MVQIVGLEKSSLLDYPGKISAIIFTYGCNLRCSYCHNPELVIEEFDKDRSISEQELLKFLDGKKGKLDAVVITGGEPLLHPDLEGLIMKIKEKGFLIMLTFDDGVTIDSKYTIAPHLDKCPVVQPTGRQCNLR